MRSLWIAACLMALSTAPARAQQPTSEVDAIAGMLRELWANPANREVTGTTIPSALYGRVLQYRLPRGFVPVSIQRSPQFYMAEFVPDGESAAEWSRMITVTAISGAAAAPLTLQQLAARFNLAGKCEPSLFQDLGGRPRAGDAEAHVVAIGCGRSPTAGGERGEQGFITLLRDDRNIYTVQVARRGPVWPDGAPPLKPEQADAELAAAGPLLICAARESPGCQDAWTIANVVPPR